MFLNKKCNFDKPVGCIAMHQNLLEYNLFRIFIIQNINFKNKKTDFIFCHPELVSGSYQFEILTPNLMTNL